MRECDIHHTRSIKTNSGVNLSRKPGLDLCCDLLQHLQGVPRTCSFYIIIRTSILLVPSLHSVLTFNNIMHILPLPPCGLYSIRAQNGYGQHRPCKIVLLTLVAPRGVTDLVYLSWGINIEHARTAYMKLVELSINKHTVSYMYFTTTTCKVEFQPPTGRTHSWCFQYFHI